MYEFKKLSDVTLLDSVPEGATVLAEVDGVINRVPGDGLGGNNSAGGYTVDYPETTYTFDGDLTGKEQFSFLVEGATVRFVRIGDCVDDNSRFIGQQMRITQKNSPVFSKTGFSCTYDNEHNVYVYADDNDHTSAFVVNETSHVRWDGVLWECEVQDGSTAFGEGTFAVGNGSGFGLNGNSEPFLLVFSSSGQSFYALNDNEAGTSHSVRIFANTEELTEITAEYIMDSSAIFDGSIYPVSQVCIINELSVLNIRADTDMALFISLLSDQFAPPQIVRKGLYAYYCYVENVESGSDISDPITSAVFTCSIGVGAGTNTVALPEKLTEVKTNRLGGYWCKGVSLVWDGDTDGLEQYSLETPLYRISDDPIPATRLMDVMIATETTAEDGTVTTKWETIRANGLTYGGNDGTHVPVMVLKNCGAPVIYSVYEDFVSGYATHKKGTYVYCRDTESDGAKTHAYVYAVAVTSGWAKWPAELVETNPDEAHDYAVLNSSTSGSTKKFKITVDDSGTLTATEITTT